MDFMLTLYNMTITEFIQDWRSCELRRPIVYDGIIESMVYWLEISERLSSIVGAGKNRSKPIATGRSMFPNEKLRSITLFIRIKRIIR